MVVDSISQAFFVFIFVSRLREWVFICCDMLLAVNAFAEPFQSCTVVLNGRDLKQELYRFSVVDKKTLSP